MVVSSRSSAEAAPNLLTEIDSGIRPSCLAEATHLEARGDLVRQLAEVEQQRDCEHDGKESEQELPVIGDVFGTAGNRELLQGDLRRKKEHSKETHILNWSLYLYQIWFYFGFFSFSFFIVVFLMIRMRVKPESASKKRHFTSLQRKIKKQTPR